MGVSTDAKLFYGFFIKEDSREHEEIEQYDEDDEKSSPLGRLANIGDGDDGVFVGYHCSDQHPMYYIAIADSELVAWRGDPQNITSLEVQPD